MRIALAGSGRLAVGLMQALLSSSHEIVAVIQNGRKTRGFKRTLVTAAGSLFTPGLSVTGLASCHEIPVVWIDRMDEKELAPLRLHDPDLILVGGFSIILKRPIIELPRIGCVNAHSSLLPKHRGPNPFIAAVLANEKKAGVTFHIIDEGIDTGDIIGQFAFPLGPQDTGLTVYNQACKVAGQHVVEVVDRIEAEGLRGVPQDPNEASYDRKPEKKDSYIDWTKPAEEIERMVRAFKPFMLSRFRYRGRTVVVTKVAVDKTPVDAEPGAILALEPRPRIATGEGSILVLTAFSPPIPWLWPSPLSRPKIGQKVS